MLKKRTMLANMDKAVTAPKQGGAALLEVLIAILIFAFGILGLVGLQANSISFLSDARDRVDASALASELASTLRVSNPDSLTTLAYAGTGTPPSSLSNWFTKLENRLPGTSADDARPIITVAQTPITYGSVTENVYTVSITVRWKPPTGTVHKHRLDFIIPDQR